MWAMEHRHAFVQLHGHGRSSAFLHVRTEVEEHPFDLGPDDVRPRRFFEHGRKAAQVPGCHPDIDA